MPSAKSKPSSIKSARSSGEAVQRVYRHNRTGAIRRSAGFLGYPFEELTGKAATEATKAEEEGQA